MGRAEGHEVSWRLRALTRIHPSDRSRSEVMEHLDWSILDILEHRL